MHAPGSNIWKRRFAAAEAECGRLTADAAKACDKHQAETSRAITAEKLLAEARERLLARIIEIDAVRQRVAQANAVTNAAYDRQRQLEDEKDQSARGAKRVARGCARSCRQSKPARPRNATVKSRGCRGRGASGLGRTGAPPWRLCGTQDSGHAGGAAGALRRLILSDLKARPPS
jgi:hypothetical protein